METLELKKEKNRTITINDLLYKKLKGKFYEKSDGFHLVQFPHTKGIRINGGLAFFINEKPKIRNYFIHLIKSYVNLDRTNEIKFDQGLLTIQFQKLKGENNGCTSR